MANQGLLHIALLTRDLKKTERFYTEVLGLKVAFRVPPNMVFLRSPASQDLINFVGTKRRISANDALQHFGFKTTKATGFSPLMSSATPMYRWCVRSFRRRSTGA